MTVPVRPRFGDAAAIGLSGLCLVHCLALPALAVALPVLGGLAEAEWAHWLFAVLAAPISIRTLARRPSNPAVLLAALAGLGLLFAGAAGYPDHDWERPLTVAGGLLVAAAHLINLGRRPHECR